MTRYAVQRCIGNTIEVLGMYETSPESSPGSAGTWTKKGGTGPARCTGSIKQEEAEP